ncbi:hypothetical protein BH18VER1_BH18VER1_05970 [soil metagenome]
MNVFTLSAVQLSPVSKQLLFSTIALVAVAVGAFGYALVGQTWPQDSTVTMQLSLGANQTLIDGSGSFNASAEDALALWNTQLNRFQFAVVRNSAVTPRDGDRKNSVFFSSKVFGESFGASTLAVTLRTYIERKIVEDDVVFNSAKSFNSYRGPLKTASGGGTLHDFHRVVLHEFGHVLGLDHPDQANQNVVAIMNSRESDVDSLQRDDINGAQYLYGGAPPPVTPTPAPAAADNLINISTRGVVGTGQNVLICGFIVQGVQPTSLVVRALGPSLTQSGVAGALSDPVVEVRDQSGNIVKKNDDWSDDPSAGTLSSKGLAPTDGRESALIVSLSAGTYTAVVSGYNGSTGVGLVELYDLQATNARAANISTRGIVQTGDRAMIAGFIVGGDKQKQVVVRAIGPSLRASGIAGTLKDPTLELRNSSGTLLASNNNWRSGPDALAIANKNLGPNHDRESALLATLNPGSYTAIIRGIQNGTGVGLAEVYDLSPPPNQ